MFGRDRYARSRELFADQFEAQGDDYLYRRGLKDAPKRVTTAERDAFVEDYVRSIKRSTWAIVGLVMLGIMIGVFVFSDSDQQWLPYVLVGPATIGALAVHRRSYDAPARALERRPVAGSAWSDGEIGQRVSARVGYRELAVATGFAALMASKAFDDDGAVRGWHALWLVAGVLLALGIAYRAARKWQIERAARHNSGNT